MLVLLKGKEETTVSTMMVSIRTFLSRLTKVDQTLLAKFGQSMPCIQTSSRTPPWIGGRLTWTASPRWSISMDYGKTWTKHPTSAMVFATRLNLLLHHRKIRFHTHQPAVTWRQNPSLLMLITTLVKLTWTSLSSRLTLSSEPCRLRPPTNGSRLRKEELWSLKEAHLLDSASSAPDGLEITSPNTTTWASPLPESWCTTLSVSL